MNRIIKRLMYLTYFSALIFITNFSVASQKVPHNFFSRLPAYEHVSLSPDGKITDALTHFVETGIANPKKACIFGASYGGYAAKMVTVKTPDLFSCAVSFAGVSDLNRLARTQRRYLGRERTAEKQLGDERDDLSARSPISNIKKIKTPLLIMHGADDIIVDVKQSREFAEELEDENKNFKYVEFEYGDHYLSIQQNRYMFFVELEKFLNEHLGN